MDDVHFYRRSGKTNIGFGNLMGKMGREIYDSLETEEEREQFVKEWNAIWNDDYEDEEDE